MGSKTTETKTKTVLLIAVMALIIVAIVFLSGLNAHQQGTTRKEIVNTDQASKERVAMKALRYPKAVELVSPDAYINSEPFNLSDYIGKKVILVDFWTYSCINCQRTLPYITAWDAKYREQGLLIVGVHTPEFDFEKALGNVQRATQKYGVKYPVVLDNEYRTWNAYQNQYWPRHYLIDIDGFIVEDHIGEGDYDETEQNIQRLLEERKSVLGLNMTIAHNTTGIVPADVKTATAEVYFGYQFARGQFGNVPGWQPEKTATYSVPTRRDDGKFYLSGTWKNNPDNMESVSDARAYLRYSAQSVNLVAGAASPSPVEVFIDGVNVKNSTVSDDDLYPLYSSAFGTHELELRSTGVRFYTFTFG